MEEGVVLKCPLPKLAFMFVDKKHDLLDSPSSTQDVIVRFAYPESTLLPFKRGAPKKGSENRPLPHALGEVSSDPNFLREQIKRKWGKKSDKKWAAFLLDWGKMIDTYDDVSQDPWLRGYTYCLDRFGQRFFFNNSTCQHVYRLGDVLTFPSIVRALRSFYGQGLTSNFLSAWSYSSHSAHDLKVIKYKKRNSKQTSAEDGRALKVCAAETTRFVNNVAAAEDVVGSPKRSERPEWLFWNLACSQYDHIRSQNMEAYAKKMRMKALHANSVDVNNECEVKKFIENLQNLQFLLIMATSEQTMDERCHDTYLDYTCGGLSSREFADMLARCPFLTCYRHFYQNLHNSSGIHKKDSEIIISLIFVLETLWGGVVPSDGDKLGSLIGIRVDGKKARVALLAGGHYRNVGAGADTHGIRCTLPIIMKYFPPSVKGKEAVKSDIEKKVHQVFSMLTLGAGVIAK